jgi:hypothetical protein
MEEEEQQQRSEQIAQELTESSPGQAHENKHGSLDDSMPQSSVEPAADEPESLLQQVVEDDQPATGKAGEMPVYARSLQNKLMNARDAYKGEDEVLVCGRFPHMDMCACDVDCQTAVRDITLFEVYKGIYMGPFQSAFKTGELIEQGITHILNVTCKAYTPRSKYFKYLDIQIYDESSEDAKRHFRITNRFLKEAF